MASWWSASRNATLLRWSPVQFEDAPGFFRGECGAVLCWHRVG